MCFTGCVTVAIGVHYTLFVVCQVLRQVVGHKVHFSGVLTGTTAGIGVHRTSWCDLTGAAAGIGVYLVLYLSGVIPRYGCSKAF